MNAVAPLTNVNLGGSPRLTLHIEADTLPELMSAINAIMGGLDPSRADFVGYDMGAEDGGNPSATIHAHDADPNAPKRGRGRPPKVTTEAAPTPAPAPAPVQTLPETPQQSAMAAMDPAPTPAPVAPTPAPDTTMAALSPADARKKGIEMVQAHFAQNPGCLPQIQAISTKFGVAQFADVKDEDALRFLADITLLVNGTGQV